MDDRRFEVRCSAKPQAELRVRTGSLSVSIGQTIMRNGTEEMWESVLILCDCGEDGVLTAKVIVSHPDWDQSVQIAKIQSRGGGTESAPPLELDIKAIPL